MPQQKVKLPAPPDFNEKRYEFAKAAITGILARKTPRTEKQKQEAAQLAWRMANDMITHMPSDCQP